MKRLKREGKSVSLDKNFTNDINRLYVYTNNDDENLDIVNQIKHHMEYISKEFKE